MDDILIFTLKWWLSDKKLRMNPPPKNTRKSKNQDSISIFSFHSFTFWSAPDKKMSTELGAGGGWGLQRQREGLVMTVMTETLESNEQRECWVCHSASSGSVSATRKTSKKEPPPVWTTLVWNQTHLPPLCCSEVWCGRACSQLHSIAWVGGIERALQKNTTDCPLRFIWGSKTSFFVRSLGCRF